MQINLDSAKVTLSYYSKGENKTISFTDSILNDDLVAQKIITQKTGEKRVTVTVFPSVELVLDQLYITVDAKYNYDSQKIFVNGYQSWTDSREFFLDEKIRGISKIAKPFVKNYHLDKYGDYTFFQSQNKPGFLHGFTYSYIRQGERFYLIGSLSERNGFTIIEHQVPNNSLRIIKDCKDLNISTDYTAFELIYAEGTENEVFDIYFDEMNIPKPKVKAMTGWTSWYNYYQNITEEIILDNLDQFEKKDQKIDIFQIDDGYQTAVGDWLSIDSNKFKSGMKQIADVIHQKGCKAGIWLAPFVCEENSELYKNKKGWLLKNKDGEPVKAGNNWSGFYALDLNNPEVKAYIREVFTVILHQWGYDMVKLDFLYAACIIPSKYKTRGQVMTEAMEFLRDCVGDKLILGCGVPLGPSFGLVDYCRIGCDIGLDWDDKPFMKLLHRERVSTCNAIKNAIGRRHLNGRAFLNDPDVFLLRDKNISLTDLQKKTLYNVNQVFGSLIFTSDNVGTYNSYKDVLLKALDNFENKEINRVETHKNNLVEVFYKEKDKNLLLLINLGKEKLNYDVNEKIKNEIKLDLEVSLTEEKNIELKAYESRIFILG